MLHNSIQDLHYSHIFKWHNKTAHFFTNARWFSFYINKVNYWYKSLYISCKSGDRIISVLRLLARPSSVVLMPTGWNSLFPEAVILPESKPLSIVKTRTIDEALAVQDLVGMRMISQREICLSDGETMRTIVVFEKVGKSRIKLPRRIGLAQKQPLRPRNWM